MSLVENLPTVKNTNLIFLQKCCESRNGQRKHKIMSVKEFICNTDFPDLLNSNSDFLVLYTVYF